MSATVAKFPDPPAQSSPRPDGALRMQGRFMVSENAVNENKEVVLPELKTSDMIVDRTKPLPTSLQSDFLPEDVLFALTQPTMTRDALAPPNRFKGVNTSMIQAKNMPANVWNHKRREKFKHLTENTTCICGAGRDISFLYDVPLSETHVERPEKRDKSFVRSHGEIEENTKQSLQLPDTLIPEEYHIVKNRGVMGLEFHEDKYSTQLDDHERHLVLFPSMKPNSRYEVLQLRRTMESMLERSGINDADVEVQGPTQMHNLLELIKKEQNIYNVVFHELIRQSSVECSERGELLADLRKNYSNLLNKVPQQIKSLHEEVMAQRALDRRLTEELMRFKSTIGVLTNELSLVKEHDKKVTKEAQKAQEDLKAALLEAQKNASLLTEYHDLYELQRKRLESHVFNLTDEKEIWSTAAYSLALKVTEECQLSTAKRLHINEKSWEKLAHHFTILLSDKDTELLTKVQSYIEKWRDMIEDFNLALKIGEEEMKDKLFAIQGGIQAFKEDFERNHFTSKGKGTKEGYLQPPDKERSIEILQMIRSWEEIIDGCPGFDEILGREVERFGGDTLLSSQEELYQIRKRMEGWTDSALRVFSRHRSLDGTTHADQSSMQVVNQEVEDLLYQYHLRLNGENGVARSIIHIVNSLELWGTRLNASFHGGGALSDTEWSSLYQLLDEWIATVAEGIKFVGTTQKEEDYAEGKPHTRIDIFENVRRTHKWMTTASSSIDSEDAKLVDQVAALHAEMVIWMVQVLLRLAPDKEGNSDEAGEMALLGSATVGQLHANAKSLFDRLHNFSHYVSLCCSGIVMDNTQQRRDLMEENSEHELRELERLRAECDDWIHTAKLLWSQVTGDPIDVLFPPPPPDSREAKRKKKKEKSERDGTPASSVRSMGTAESSDEKPAEPSSDQAELVLSSPVKEGDAKIGTDEQKDVEDKTTEELPISLISSNDEPTAVDQDVAATYEETVEAIGYDDNTHMHHLQQDASQAPQANSSEAADKPRPETPNTKKAYEALAALSDLQMQLLSTEERAQQAEVRSAIAEANFAASQEKLRALEKRLQQLESEEKPEEKPQPPKSSPSPVAVTTKAKTKDDIKEEKKRADSQASVSGPTRAGSKVSSKKKK